MAGDAYSPAEDRMKGRSSLPIYSRQLFPDHVYGEKFDQGETLNETDSVRLWRMPKVDQGIAILSFKSKMHSLGTEVLVGLNRTRRAYNRRLRELLGVGEVETAQHVDEVHLRRLVGGGERDRRAGG